MSEKLVRPMDNWQPIETAPKAGVVVMLFDPTFGQYIGFNQLGYVWFPQFENQTPSPYDTWFMSTGNRESMGDDYPIAPTLWMPLPPNPDQ